MSYELQYKKTNLQGFRPILLQTVTVEAKLEDWNFFSKKVVENRRKWLYHLCNKNKGADQLISYAVTAQLILCLSFRIGKKMFFSCCGSYRIVISKRL